jgi:WD40 repeat protein
VIDERELVRRAVEQLAPPEPSFERLVGRRDRRERRRRNSARVLGLAIVLALGVAALTFLRSDPAPPVDNEQTPLPTDGTINTFGIGSLIEQYEPGGDQLDPVVDCGGLCSLIRDVAWTPDGSRMAYIRQCAGAGASCGDPTHGIRVLDLRTGTDEVVLAGDNFIALDWSPDGTRIAYTDGGPLHIIELDGSEVGTVPEISGADSLSWSAGGSLIAYSVPTIDGFRIARVDGSNELSLPRGDSPEFSPDGSRIAFMDGCEVWTAGPDGRQRDLVVELPFGTGACLPPGAPSIASGPVWSPDGTQLAVLTNGAVKIIDVSDGEIRTIASRGPGSDFGVDWRPV